MVATQEEMNAARLPLDRPDTALTYRLQVWARAFSNYHFMLLSFPVMVATQEEMSAARLPLDRRDYCAHFLIDYYKCRQYAFPRLNLCNGKKHDYDVCEFEE